MEVGLSWQQQLCQISFCQGSPPREPGGLALNIISSLIMMGIRLTLPRSLIMMGTLQLGTGQTCNLHLRLVLIHQKMSSSVLGNEKRKV